MSSLPTFTPIPLTPLNPQHHVENTPASPPELTPLQKSNLAIFPIWENYIQDGEAVNLDQAKGWLGRAFSFVGDWVRKDGKTHLDDIHAHWELERRVLGEAKRIIETRQADTILVALRQIADSGPEDLKKRTRQLLEEARIHTPDGSYLLGHLLRYVSHYPPEKAHAEELFEDADQTEIRYQGAQTPFAIYELLATTSQETTLQSYCAKKLSVLKDGKSTFRMVGDLIRTIGTDDLAQIATMSAATKVGALARLATLDKLKTAGITGYKAVSLGWGAHLAAEGTTMWALNTAQESAFHDTEKSLDPKHLAKSYAANMVMLGAVKPLSALGGGLRARLLQSAEQMGEGMLKQRLATQALGWSAQHAFGLGGMLASTQINQGLGLHEKPQGGFAESFIHDAFGYAKYGFAQEGFDHLLGADFVQKNQELHQKISKREQELISAQKLKTKFSNEKMHPLLNPWLQPYFLLTGMGMAGSDDPGPAKPKADSPSDRSNKGGDKGNKLKILLPFGAGLVTLLGSENAQAALNFTHSQDSANLGVWGAGLGMLAIGGIFHWLSGKLKAGLVDSGKTPFSENPEKLKTPFEELDGNMTLDKKIDRSLLAVDEWDLFDGIYIGRLNRPTEINGLHCESGLIQIHEDGGLATAILMRDQELPGFRQRIFGAAGTRVSFHSNGALAKVTLAKPARIEGLRHLKNADLYFDDTGKLFPEFVLPRKNWKGPGNLAGLVGMGVGLSTFFRAENSHASDGVAGMGTSEAALITALATAVVGSVLARKWYSRWLSSPDRLQLNVLWRFKKGHEREGLLLSDQKVLDFDLPSGSSVRFDGEGALSEIQLAEAPHLLGFDFLKGDRLVVDAAMQLKAVTLGHDGIFQGHRYHAGDLLEFDGKGKLKGANLRTDQILQGLPLQANSYVAFHPNGTIDFAFLQFDHVIEGIPCSSGFVSFHNNGRLKSADLAQEMDINGILLPKGSRLKWTDEGELEAMSEYRHSSMSPEIPPD